MRDAEKETEFCEGASSGTGVGSGDIEHRETMKVLSEKFESLNGGFGEKVEKEEPESRVIEGANGRKTLLTPRDGPRL